MADPIAGPNIVSATRVNGAWIDVRYTAGASGYTRVYVFVRKTGTSSFVQANSSTTLNGQIVVSSVNGAALDVGAEYDVRMQAAVGSTLTEWSNIVKSGKWSVATPTLVSLTRVSEKRANFVYEGAVTGSGNPTIYVERREVPSGAWRQVTAFANSASGSYGLDLVDGLRGYEVRIRSGQWGVLSGYSSVRSVAAWWQLPASATNLLGSRITAGTVTLTWSATATTQAPIAGQRIYRAAGDTGQYVRVATITGDKRTWQDTSASPTVAYKYAVEPYNQAGPASSRPTVSVAATIIRPTAPSAAPTVTYVATDKARLTWSLNTASNRPYKGQRVRMRTVGATSWATVADVGPGVTDVTVTVGANRLVEFAIEPYNDAGASEVTSPVSARLATTPALPRGLAGKWGTGASIVTSWLWTPTTGAPIKSIGDAIDVEFATDGGTSAATWYPGTTPSSPLPITSTSWIHGSVSLTVPHWYRLRVRRADVAGSPESAWLYSGEVQAQTKPLAPTLIQPVSVDATDTIRLALVHNPVDGTPQTLAQIRYRLQGGTTWTTRTLTTATYYDLAAGTYTNGQTLEVQGQTAGASGVYSDWSGSLLVTLRARMVVAITSPAGGLWPSPTVTVTWTATGQVEALVELLDGAGALVASQLVGAAVREATLPVEDRSSYSVRVTGRDAYQSSLPAVVAITVALERPAPPDLTAVFREGAGASVLLAGRPVTALQTQRRNIAPALDMGSRTAPTVTAQMISLRHDGGTYEPGLRIDVADAQTGMEWHGLDNRADGEMVGGTVMLTTLADTPVAAEVILKINGNPVYTLPASVPQWPDHVVVQTSPTSMPGAPSIEVVSTMPSTQLVAARVGIIGTRTGSGWSDYFDGSATSDSLVYVVTPEGIVVEGLAVAAGGDIPVVSTVRIQYWRSIDGGASWQDVGDGGSDWSLVDPTPPLTRVLYRARAYGAAGGWVDSAPVTVDTRTCDAYLHAGGRVLHAGWEPTFSGTAGREAVLRRYVGRDKPAPIFGARQPRTQTYQLTLRDDSTPLAAWVDAAEHPGTVTVRDPGGRNLTGVLAGFDWDDSSDEEQAVSFTVTESEAL